MSVQKISFLNTLAPFLLVILTAFNISSLQAQELRPIRQSDSNDILIVFIHGIRDDGENTWRNQKTDANWPDLLANDAVFDAVDIATFHYPSDVWEKGGLSIGNVADNLRVYLDSSDFSSYKKIVFISHSMGGLITRSFLLKNRHYGSKVPMVFFLSTPTGGSNLADWASVVARNNAQLEGLKELQENQFLQEQVASWQSWPEAREIKSYCAYETLPTKGVFVVNQANAQLLCNQKPIPLQENHSGVSKPKSPSSPTYIVFKTAFEEIFSVPLFKPPLTGEIVLRNDSLPAEETFIFREIVLDSDVDFGEESVFIYAENVDLNGYMIRGKRITIASSSIANGTVDSSRFAGGGEIVLASARISNLRVLAKGKHGRSGEDGVNGSIGANGASGRNGKCDGFGGYKGARPGADGRDGSDGTDGKDGLDGEDGAKIYVVTLSERADLHIDVSGGESGRGGKGGAGGKGGPGGRGGKGCVGLGGTQMNEPNGNSGSDGLDGRDGRDGRKGSDGEFWFKQVSTLKELGEVLPESNSLTDYNVKTRKDFVNLILQR